MRAPDAVSRIDWPDGWIDGKIVGIDSMGLRLKTGGSATILTACTDKGTCLAVLDAPGAQRLGRMRVAMTPAGPVGGAFEEIERGRKFITAADRPLADAWSTVVRSYVTSRNEVEAAWPTRRPAGEETGDAS